MLLVALAMPGHIRVIPVTIYGNYELNVVNTYNDIKMLCIARCTRMVNFNEVIKLYLHKAPHHSVRFYICMLITMILAHRIISQ